MVMLESLSERRKEEEEEEERGGREGEKKGRGMWCFSWPADLSQCSVLEEA